MTAHAHDDLSHRLAAVIDGTRSASVLRVSSSVDVQALVSEVTPRVGKVWLVDGPAHTKDQLMEAFAAGCSLPPWFGRNYDALADCLGDLDVGRRGAILVWSTAGQYHAAAPSQWSMMRSILEHAVRIHADAGTRLTMICVGGSLPGVDPL
jgi:hypothetical protein